MAKNASAQAACMAVQALLEEFQKEERGCISPCGGGNYFVVDKILFCTQEELLMGGGTLLDENGGIIANIFILRDGSVRKFQPTDCFDEYEVIGYLHGSDMDLLRICMERYKQDRVPVLVKDIMKYTLFMQPREEIGELLMEKSYEELEMIWDKVNYEVQMHKDYSSDLSKMTGDICLW